MIGDSTLDLSLSAIVRVKFDHTKLASIVVRHHWPIKVTKSEGTGSECLVFMRLQDILIIKEADEFIIKHLIEICNPGRSGRRLYERLPFNRSNKSFILSRHFLWLIP